VIFWATSDIHSPRYLDVFFLSRRNLPPSNLILLAGDLVDKGRVIHFDPIYRALSSTSVIAVFGNEDFREVRDEFRRMYPKVIWLEDESHTVTLDHMTIEVVGSEGIISRPTKWQRELGISEEIYMKRFEKINKLLCDSKADYLILLTHYASSYVTVTGERRWAYPELGYPLVENVECKPDLAVHGHAHKATVLRAVVGNVKVYNVALPANKQIVSINVDLNEKKRK